MRRPYICRYILTEAPYWGQFALVSVITPIGARIHHLLELQYLRIEGHSVGNGREWLAVAKYLHNYIETEEEETIQFAIVPRRTHCTWQISTILSKPIKYTD